MPSIHINASPGDFADSVLMPGDPLRAKYIAETFLDGARQVTDVRNMLGFTGEYRNRPVSVMAHGMEIASASIYCTELIRDFGVKRVIRVGSCGTVHPDVKLRNIIIAMGASTDSGVNRMRFGGHDLAPLANFDLLRTAVRAAEAKGLHFHVGNIFSADLFYTPQPEDVRRHGKVPRPRYRDGDRRHLHPCRGTRRRGSRHLHGQRQYPQRRGAVFSRPPYILLDQMIQLALETVANRVTQLGG